MQGTKAFLSEVLRIIWYKLRSKAGGKCRKLFDLRVKKQQYVNQNQISPIILLMINVIVGVKENANTFPPTFKF